MTVALWDEAAIDRAILRALDERPLEPVATAAPPRAPAAYLLYYSGSNPRYRSVSDSMTPIYVGSGLDIRRRLREHRTSLVQARNLRVGDFSIQFLLAPTHEAVAYTELRLIRIYDPLWNQDSYAGFGSKNQGRARVAAQKSTPWDRLHPGRRWAARGGKRPLSRTPAD